MRRESPSSAGDSAATGADQVAPPDPPSYRKYKQSGQAIVTLRLPSGKRKGYLLGPYGSEGSKAEYGRLVGELQAGRTGAESVK